jgi:acyl-CoA synthetase (AMP-forming)/AMP-acid ligase II
VYRLNSLFPATNCALTLEKLPSWQVPKDWWLVESIDADQRGKISRVLWRQRYMELRNEHSIKPSGG